MRHLFLVLLVFTVKPHLVFSQITLLDDAHATPFLHAEKNQPVGNAVYGASLAEVLDRVFDSLANQSPINGFNAAMLLPDGSVWKRAAGKAAVLPAVEPLTTDHLMAMGSISKTFVATTLLLLADDGLLNLGDSIGQYVGPYPNIPGHVTIRQLLGHRSGINDYLNENPAMSQAFIDHVDSIWVADTILNHYVLAPNFPVGADWSYSNTNYLLAGRIIEAITGQPWHSVVRQRLINPLDLTHTFVFPYETPGAQPFSHCFIDVNGDGVVDDWQGVGLPVEGLFSMANSAGCLISTPEDLTRFAKQVFSGQVLQPATLAEMQTDYVLNPAAGLFYGLGAISFFGLSNEANWGHNGDLFYKSIALYFPDRNMSLAVQQNDDRVASLANPIVDLNDVFIALMNAYFEYLKLSSASEISERKPLTVFPNPAGDVVYLDFDQNRLPEFPANWVLSNVSGQVVATQALHNTQETVYIGHLPKGVYGWRVGSDSGLMVKK